MGLWDLKKKGKVNPISVLGLANVGLTGTLGYVQAEGIWFAVKEAGIPLLIGTLYIVYGLHSEASCGDH